jgi:biotin carboxyl carrier protein
VVEVRFVLPLAAANAAVLACAVLAAGAVGTVAATALAPSAQDAPRPAAVESPAAVLPSPVPSAAPRAAVAPPAPPAPSPAVDPPAPKASPKPVAPAKRVVVQTGWRPYAMAGPVTLHYPGDVVEVVGLHQSGHDGAQPQQPVEGPARIGLLDTRGRDTNPQGAADIVVDPTREVRSPVTGTVLRAGSYTLYCDHVDDYVVVEPDARPGWEVKLLHFEGVAVRKGMRVEAGVTVVGSRARLLPFASQVDKHTVAPHWPHLHIEVVDPSVKDRPSGGSCD